MHAPSAVPRLRPSSRRSLALAVLATAASLVALAASVQPAAAGFARGGTLPQLGSGRIWGVAAQPGAAATVLAASDHGVYLSHDSGATWEPTSYATGRVWTVGFDARNSSLAFAGTAGSGVLASSDGGQTWQPSSAGLLNKDVRSLAFGLEGIAAGTAAGVFLSPDGHAWHDVGLDGSAVSAVVVAANAPSLTIIAGLDGGSLNGGYLFRSSAGNSWQTLQSGLPSGAVVSGLASGPIDQAVPQRPLVAATTKGLYRSGDGGTTWTPSTGVTTGVVITTATFSPLDPNLVYAGSDAAGSTGGDLLRSTDGGVSFTPDDQGLPSSKNVESITVGQTNPPTVVAALDPPNGTAHTFNQVDATAPSPPQLTAESPGAPIPGVVSTPRPTPRATPAPVTSSGPPVATTGAAALIGTIFHWPIPLIYELIFVLLVVYLFLRWRQHYYVEGPP